MLASFLNSIHFPAVVFDQESKTIVAVNTSAKTLFGQQVETLMGRSISEFLIPEGRTRLGDSSETVGLTEPIEMPWDVRKYELKLLLEESIWNGRTAGLAVLCDVDEISTLSHDSADYQGKLAAAVLESALEGIIVINELGIIQSTNSAADLMFGYPNHELIGRPVEVLMPHATAIRHEHFVAGATQRGISQPGRPRLFRSVRKSGQEFDTAVSLTQLSGKPLLFCSIIRDVTGDRLEQQRLEQMALTDQITGLANRRTFEDWWTEFSAVRRPVALLLIELQRVSVLIEGFGRQVADEVLAVIGGRLEQTAAAVGAQVARSEAGQFLVFAPDQNQAEAEKLAKTFHADIKGEIDALGVLFQPVLNIGVALRKGTQEPSSSAIAEASVALANLNRIGVGLTSLGDSSAQSRAADELTMESALRKALHSGDLVAAMQPVYRIADSRIAGAEMLARWTWDAQTVSPTTFVGLAERTGLINMLSGQILQHALNDLPRFIKASGGKTWLTWVNISPRELIEVNFGERFLKELQSAGADPTRIGIEVTETALLANPKTAENTLRELREAGVGVALDDFGTGFSSLSILKDIEVDVIKIDRSFTKALLTNTRVAAIVAGVISSATAMGSEVVAEGVETEQQFEWLAEFGCHFAQGFLFSGAVTPDQLLDLMKPPS